ncbi:hypothetical protein I6A95_016920 [Clostridioides difficile]
MLNKETGQASILGQLQILEHRSDRGKGKTAGPKAVKKGRTLSDKIKNILSQPTLRTSLCSGSSPNQDGYPDRPALNWTSCRDARYSYKAFETYWPGASVTCWWALPEFAARVYLLIQSIRQAKIPAGCRVRHRAHFGAKEDIKPFVDPKFRTMSFNRKKF